MQLNIKNEKAYRLAQELARRTGTSMTGAVVKALEESLEREDERRNPDAVFERLMEIGRECAGRANADARSHDDLVGYDEHGAPV
ncbi:MAG: type II toxin-antitoxin system VapB family antitoxin [Alphaproteobacteria bacterium]